MDLDRPLEIGERVVTLERLPAIVRCYEPGYLDTLLPDDRCAVRFEDGYGETIAIGFYPLAEVVRR